MRLMLIYLSELNPTLMLLNSEINVFLVVVDVVVAPQEVCQINISFFRLHCHCCLNQGHYMYKKEPV
jgi:hypothetical protein